MLSTRLWMGTILVLLTLGMLLVDPYVPRWHPILCLFVIGLSLAGCAELLSLLGAERKPQRELCLAGVFGLGCANWLAHIPPTASWHVPAWNWIVGCLALVVLGVFLTEMATFREPGRSLERMSLTLLVVCYLGLLPCFFAQQRWMHGPELPGHGTVALALTIFVPKCCDIGAYFTGRMVGRHRMTPVLSPKKTWEGAAGGLALAGGVAIGIDRLGPAPLLKENLGLELAFGLTVGLAGMLGDLAESLIKRDCERKDASQAVPGFGGVLDVVDAILFAAPVAYAWFAWIRIQS